MRRLFIANFDFEHELAGLATRGRGLSPERQGGLASGWLAIAREGDAVWLPMPWEPGFLADAVRAGLPGVQTFVYSEMSAPKMCEAARAFVRQAGSGWEVVPWGWSASAYAIARIPELGATATLGDGLARHAAPLPDVVRQINSRRFAWALEQDWGCGLAQSRWWSEWSACEAHLATIGDKVPWVIKAEFGMSGRERCFGRGPHLSDPQRGWIRKRFAMGQGLLWEPWLDRIEEAGLQFDIPIRGEGAPTLIGVSPLFSTMQGQYAGSLIPSQSEQVELHTIWREAVELATRAAMRIQVLGYHGPIGFDAMRYRDDTGTPRVRALQDINARYTMGRLALGYGRLLTATQTAVWWHAPLTAADDVLVALHEKWSQSRIIRMSPMYASTPSRGEGTPASTASHLIILENHARSVEPDDLPMI